MLKGVQGGYMSSTQQRRRDTDRHTQTHEIDARDRRTRRTTRTGSHETLKGVNTFNMLKGVQGGYMSSTQQRRRDTDRHTQTHEIDARDEQRGQGRTRRLKELIEGKGVNRR